MNLKRWTACCLGLLLPLSVAAEVLDTTLDNGLRVIVKPDHRAPVVTSMVWYKVGSSYEHDGITGVSHVLEHMMFQGTETHAAGEFSRIIAANGGSQNAFTSRDYTGYYQKLSKDRLEVSFELEADRMRRLVLDPQEFEKEVKVVQEERRQRTDDKPRGLAYERFMAAAFVSSGYHWPIIGWMNDLENLTLEQTGAWYRRWYAPNNATLVVVGDVDPDQVLELAQTHFGPLPPTDPAPVAPQRRELEPRGERRVEVKAPAKLPYVLMGYQVPVLTSTIAGQVPGQAPDQAQAQQVEEWETYALEVLAWVLDGNGSSRLSKALVRGSEVAAGASAGYDLYARNESLFTLSGTPANGHRADQLEQALRDQIEALQQAPVSADELERVRNGVIAQKVYELDSIQYQATVIGKLVTAGLDWREARAYVDKVLAVTPEQIQAVARKYLVDDRLTVATLRPHEQQDAQHKQQAEAGHEG